MTGGSYNGTTAIATAVPSPPHLTTIVPEAAISRWYEYAYSGGIRYTWTNEGAGNQGPGSAADEGLDTPLAFDFGFAIPPPVDVADPAWAERVESTVAPCEEITHTEHGYDLTPDYDRFWLERDYIKDAGDIRIPVLVAHNWGDWNVKQEEAFNLYRSIGLSIQTEIAEWATPKPYGGCDSAACNTVTLDWRSGRTKLVLPVVGGTRPFS